MQLTVTELDDGIRMVELKGRMDIDGTQKIGLQLAAVTATEKVSVIMDLSLVEFMASIGIGAIVGAANAARQRGGKIVLFNPRPIVALVLEKTGVDAIIPIVTNLDAARTALRA
jgi:anti-sigma B factor antagonist